MREPSVCMVEVLPAYTVEMESGVSVEATSGDTDVEESLGAEREDLWRCTDIHDTLWLSFSAVLLPHTISLPLAEVLDVPSPLWYFLCPYHRRFRTMLRDYLYSRIAYSHAHQHSHCHCCYSCWRSRRARRVWARLVLLLLMMMMQTGTVRRRKPDHCARVRIAVRVIATPPAREPLPVPVEACLGAILAATPEAARFVGLGSTRKYTAWPDAHGDGVLAGERALLASGRPGVLLHPTMIYGAQGEDNVRRQTQPQRTSKCSGDSEAAKGRQLASFLETSRILG